MTIAPAIEVDRTRTGRPRYKTNSDAITYWTERVVQKREDRWTFEDYDRNSIIMSGDTLYHYGTHFPLAQIVRKPNGWARIVLFNGDRYTGASGWGTSTQGVQMETQRAVREQIRESGKDIPTVTIPFSTLDSAGIDRTTVRLLDVLEDRTEITKRSSRERPGDYVKIEDPSGATYMHTEQVHGHVHRDTGEVWGQPGWREVDGTSQYVSGPANREDYDWKLYDNVTERPVMVDDLTRANVEGRDGSGWVREPAILGDDGLWRWEVETHKLGEALFTARYTTHHRRPATAEEVEAYEAVESWTKRYQLAGYPSTGTLEHEALGERPNGPDVDMFKQSHVSSDASYTVRFTKTRVEKFLSSYDYAEPHRPYFMCELPHSCPARTIPEALEALKPPEVVAAEDAGVEVLRQGDIFAIRTAMTDDDLLPRARTVLRQFFRSLNEAPWSVGDSEHVAIRKIGQEGIPTEARLIHGSTHQVTHLIVTKDGDHYGRGRMYHRPGGWGRTAEHVVVELGDRKTWYRLVKNTVPSGRGGSALGNAVQSGTSRAWMLGGAVD